MNCIPRSITRIARCVSPPGMPAWIKWLTNNSEGIPAYIKIDMATQDTELVKLDEGMKYTTSDHFNRNIYRHLRFRYPTYIFNDLSFEVDEEGTPYWICPVKKYNIGLFGGVTIGRVVLCNAITGEMEDYAIEDAPQWIDRAFSADLLVELYDYHGTLKHGFLNSVLGQKDCLATTDGYNYLAIDDDVWVHRCYVHHRRPVQCGVRAYEPATMETRFYEVEGATEASAMASAGRSGAEPALYGHIPASPEHFGRADLFIALKDDAGLVKMYAMVNVQKYQIVGHRRYGQRM